MPATPKDVALRVAERIRSLIESSPFEHGAAQPNGHVTISGGVATWPGDGEDVDSLLRSADEALYQAKRAGRNRVLAHTAAELALAGAEASFTGAELGDDAEREKSEG
jgi:diguanylate cyclase (GGDEF)-like protein